MMLGEIRTWRPEGAPDGVEMLEIAQQPLRALHIPIETLPAAEALDELAGFGVFFLLEPAGGPGQRPRVYIGGTEHLAEQLAYHRQRPRLAWRTAVVIPLAPPKVPRFSRELTKLMQFHCHRRATQVRNHVVVNEEPACPSLVPAFLDRDLGASRTAIQTLLFALGHPVLGSQLRVVK
jgi:hypothetical protein